MRFKGFWTAAFITLFWGIVLNEFALTPRMFANDTWWHLSQGREIFEHGNFSTETLSFTAKGGATFSHSWLTDTFFYLTYHLGGYKGLQLLGGMLVIAIFALMTFYSYSLSIPLWLSLIPPLLLRILCGSQLLLRPQLISDACLLLLLILLRARSFSIQCISCLLLFCFWSNCHGSFLFGIIFLAALILLKALEIASNTTSMLTVNTPRQLLVFIIIAITGCCIHPFGVKSFYYAIQNDPLKMGIHQLVDEWQPLKYLDSPLYFWILFCSIIILITQKSRLLDRSILLGVSLLPLDARRHLQIFSIIGVPLLLSLAWNAWGLDVTVNKNARLNTSKVNLFFHLFGMSISYLLLFFIFFKNLAECTNDSFLNQDRIRNLEPVRAAAWIQHQALQGHLLNAFENGGYLGFVLNGNPGVFIDGRIRPYLGSVMDDYLKIIARNDNWGNLLEKYGIEYVLLPTSYELLPILEKDTQWTRVFAEDSYIILKKNSY